MQKLIEEFLKQKRFAVVGSFKNESKVAYRILKMLQGKRREVVPVNPNLKEVEGLTCYSSVKDIPVVPDVVDIVTPPAVTEKIILQCKEKGIGRVWIQPGAESDYAIQLCKENGIDVIFDRCIMVEMQ